MRTVEMSDRYLSREDDPRSRVARATPLPPTIRTNYR